MISQDAGSAIPRGLNPPPLWPSASRPDVAGPSGLPTARAPVAGGSREVFDGSPPDARAPTIWKRARQPGQNVQAGMRHEAARGAGGGWVAPPISTSPPSLWSSRPLVCGHSDSHCARLLMVLHVTLHASAWLRGYGPSLAQGDAGGALIYQQ